MWNLKFSDAASLFGGSDRKANFDDRITYQFVVPNVFQLASRVNSPLFATSNDTFWQLVFGPSSEKEKDVCDLFLTAIPNAQESLNPSIWEQRSRLTARVYLMEHATRTDIISKEFKTNGYSAMGTWLGFRKIWKKTPLEGNKIIVGVEFKDTPPPQTINPVLDLPWNSMPEDLIEAWHEHLVNEKTSDVKFLINDQTIYGHSDILKKRSQYFRDFFETGPPPYEPLVEIDDTAVSSSSDPIEPASTPSYHQTIIITDYTYSTFLEMMRFIYSGKVTFTNPPAALKLYEIAVKYQLAELQQRAKIEICQTLTVRNSPAILFETAYKYPDLREMVIKFVADNFQEIRETSELKGIIDASAQYPHFAEVVAEIFALLGPNAEPL